MEKLYNPAAKCNRNIKSAGQFVLSGGVGNYSRFKTGGVSPRKPDDQSTPVVRGNGLDSARFR
jgi:hypothetical protein